jgi:alpha,alpha-trehalase
VRTDQVFQALVRDEDTDGDRQITIKDTLVAGTGRGDRKFQFESVSGRRYDLSGTYYLSNLLQDLALAREEGRATLLLTGERLFAPPAERISRAIRELHWAGLSRTIDEKGIPRVIADDKTSSPDGLHYLFVPSSDTVACRYYEAAASRHGDWNVRVERLPSSKDPSQGIPPPHVQGLLSLALRPSARGELEGVPFVVPGGRFNEMYGWDSYFILLGLLQDGKVGAARSIVDNFVYEIRHYGGVLNANRTYYLTRSQPPFLTSMARAVFAHIAGDPSAREWLRGVVAAAIQEYRDVWSDSFHRTATGLTRYMDRGKGIPPEVEQGHFRPLFHRYATAHGMDPDTLERQYRDGTAKIPELDVYFTHDRAMRESGHDTSYRLEGICADLVTVDLNSLLYRYEKDLAEIIAGEFGGAVELPDGTSSSTIEWEGRAAAREWLITNYLWDAKAGTFFDFDFVRWAPHRYVSATAFYPLWARLATPEQASLLVEKTLPLLEMPGGIAASSEASRGEIRPDRPQRQWDYPYGWAPHQMLLWQGLMNYGFDSLALRLAYRWLFMIAQNASNYNGTIPEKFDVVRRSHEVFAEYGNVGTRFAYITKEGFGWTNASFQVGLAMLPADLRQKLDSLTPPESIFTPTSGKQPGKAGDSSQRNP